MKKISPISINHPNNKLKQTPIHLLPGMQDLINKITSARNEAMAQGICYKCEEDVLVDSNAVCANCQGGM